MELVLLKPPSLGVHQPWITAAYSCARACFLLARHPLAFQPRVNQEFNFWDGVDGVDRIRTTRAVPRVGVDKQYLPSRTLPLLESRYCKPIDSKIEVRRDESTKGAGVYSQLTFQT